MAKMYDLRCDAERSNTLPGLVTNVETIELQRALSRWQCRQPFNGLDVERSSSKRPTAAGALQVANIRNTAEIELQGNFNNTVNIDFLMRDRPAEPDAERCVRECWQPQHRAGFHRREHHLGRGRHAQRDRCWCSQLLAGNNLQSLTIDGEVDFEVIGGAINFRPNTTGVIDASGFTGDNLSLTVNAQNDIEFTGSDANDALTVTTAGRNRRPDAEITLNADFGAGDNTLTVNAVVSRAVLSRPSPASPAMVI